jgi:hypothetical protein
LLVKSRGIPEESPMSKVTNIFFWKRAFNIFIGKA